VLARLILPGGIRLQEALFLAAAAFAFIDWIFWKGLSLRRTPLDVPVGAFLASALLAAAVGTALGNLPTVIFRDLRFPLYYAVIFLVTQTADTRFCLDRLLPAVILAGVLVGTEYVLEFAGAVDLSTGHRFVRVARVQGIVMPTVLLLLVNRMIHAPEQYGYWKPAVLFAAVSPAFVLTVGRGMWLAFAVGLLVSVLLWHWSRPREQRRLWQAAAVVVGMAGTIVVVGGLFQRVTGSAIGAHAVERLTTLVDYTRDIQFLGRLSSYALTVQRILVHPVWGSGQGATLPFFFFDAETGAFGVRESWTVDSLYLALLWKGGLVELACFAWMGLVTLRLSVRVFRQSPEPRMRAFAAGTVAVGACMAVLGLSDASLVSSRFALVFGVLMGMIAVADGDSGGGSDRREAL